MPPTASAPAPGPGPQLSLCCEAYGADSGVGGHEGVLCGQEHLLGPLFTRFRQVGPGLRAARQGDGLAAGLPGQRRAGPLASSSSCAALSCLTALQAWALVVRHPCLAFHAWGCPDLRLLPFGAHLPFPSAKSSSYPCPPRLYPVQVDEDLNNLTYSAWGIGNATALIK